MSVKVSLKNAKRLVKRVLMTNIYTGQSNSVTPLISGSFGIGKTAICHEIAKDFGGVCLVVEGGSLKEGEFPGLPFEKKLDDGEAEVSFVKYYIIKSVERLQKLYYERYHSEGFLNGTIKAKDSEEKSLTVEKYSEENQIRTVLGKDTDNKYEWGNDLDGKTKIALLQSKEIMHVIILIDEANRTDSQTMKEFMNIIQTKTINGYRLPWWVSFVATVNPAGPDSQYATNEMDPAQLDRFIKIPVIANAEDTIDHLIDMGIDEDYALALSQNQEILQCMEKGVTDDTEDVKPSPRSHAFCGFMVKYASDISNSGYFSVDDKKTEKSDISELIRFKLGQTAGRTMCSALENKKALASPNEILTGKSNKLTDEIKTKIANMQSLQSNITAKRIIHYIASDLIDYKIKSITEPSSKEATIWKNIISQLNDYCSIVSPNTRIVLAKSACSTKIDKSKFDGTNLANRLSTVFRCTSCCFAQDVLSQVAEYSEISEDSLNKK